MNCKEESDMESWLACIRGMAQILRQNMQIASPEELARARDQRFKTNRSDRKAVSPCLIPPSTEVAESSGISGPYNPQHLTHITHDFKWAGDIAVFKFTELLGKGYVSSFLLSHLVLVPLVLSIEPRFVMLTLTLRLRR